MPLPGQLNFDGQESVIGDVTVAEFADVTRLSRETVRRQFKRWGCHRVGDKVVIDGERLSAPIKARIVEARQRSAAARSRHVVEYESVK